jgi:hypothetical protein
MPSNVARNDTGSRRIVGGCTPAAGGRSCTSEPTGATTGPAARDRSGASGARRYRGSAGAEPRPRRCPGRRSQATPSRGRVKRSSDDCLSDAYVEGYDDAEDRGGGMRMCARTAGQSPAIEPAQEIQRTTLTANSAPCKSRATAHFHFISHTCGKQPTCGSTTRKGLGIAGFR